MNSFLHVSTCHMPQATCKPNSLLCSPILGKPKVCLWSPKSSTFSGSHTRAHTQTHTCKYTHKHTQANKHTHTHTHTHLTCVGAHVAGARVYTSILMGYVGLLLSYLSLKICLQLRMLCIMQVLRPQERLHSCFTPPESSSIVPSLLLYIFS